MGFEKAIGVMMMRKFWANTLVRMLPDEADYRKFWDDFWTINAHNSRCSAVAGTKNTSHAFEQALYNAAILAGKSPMEASTDTTPKDPDFNRPYGFMSYEQIGMAFVAAVSENDPRIFTRLAKVIQNSGTLPANKGGEDSMLGQYWRDFCQYLINHQKLPSKAELRKAGEFSHDHAYKCCKKLGLSGLA